MLTPSTAYPRRPFDDLRQRVAVACFHRMYAAIEMHVVNPNASRSELESEVFVRAMKVLVERLRQWGRPDLAEAIDDIYRDARRDQAHSDGKTSQR